MFGRKQRTIDALRRRVAELEERLCPCDSHEGVATGAREYFFNGADVDVLVWYKCKKCGKAELNFRWGAHGT